MAVLSCVYAQMHFCVSMRRRSCLQVLYEFHLSAAWGTMWRISPNGLVCNCSVNTCLSRLGECGGKKGPSLQRTEATYWAANSYLPLDGGRQRRGPSPARGTLWLIPHTQDFSATSSLWTKPILSQEAEPVAQTGDREVCVYVEQVVLSWLLVFAGPGCVCSLLL